MRRFTGIGILLLLLSCGKEGTFKEISLSDYLVENESLELADLVACAGGKSGGFLGGADKPTDVFFYPVSGARDFRYFETQNLEDSADFNKFFQVDLEDEPVFNGYLWKFNRGAFEEERMGVVTYRTPGKLHVCTPIRLKTNVKPTEVNPGLLEVVDHDLSPEFVWADGQIQENVIYFQVISDLDDNFISGTYTFEKNFTFYDLSNVVFNITDTASTPSLNPGQTYRFTLMGVSEDNWINLYGEREFEVE